MLMWDRFVRVHFFQSEIDQFLALEKTGPEIVALSATDYLNQVACIIGMVGLFNAAEFSTGEQPGRLYHG